MNIPKSLERKMREADIAGKGSYYSGAKAGELIFSTCIENGELGIYEDGFAFGKGGVIKKILFYDVKGVNSHLNAEVISRAGSVGVLDFYLPLDICLREGVCCLGLPFLNYSKVLNILVEAKEAWISKHKS